MIGDFAGSATEVGDDQRPSVRERLVRLLLGDDIFISY